MEASLENFRKLGAAVVDVRQSPTSTPGTRPAPSSSPPRPRLPRHWLRTRAQDYSERFAAARAGLAIPAASYIDALRMRGVALREFCERVFSKVDVLPRRSCPPHADHRGDRHRRRRSRRKAPRPRHAPHPPRDYLGLPASAPTPASARAACRSHAAPRAPVGRVLRPARRPRLSTVQPTSTCAPLASSFQASSLPACEFGIRY